MRLLVTGGMGFIGSNFIRHYLERHQEARIVNVDALKAGSNPESLRGIDEERYTFVEGDISDRLLMADLVEKADAVVNFAAETHVDRSISGPEPFLASNVAGTFSILEALRTRNPGARLVHISTDEVYGDVLSGSFRETDALRPSSPYSASKAASDVFVSAYARTYGLSAMITRCTNNYGPRQFPEKLIPKAIIRANTSLKVPIYGTGENVRDWIFVLDHCRAVEMVLEAGEAGEVYNVSSGEERTNLAVVRALLEILGKGEEAIEFVEDRPGHDLRYSLDSSKIRRELGWRPDWGFREGMEETVRWYVENESWWRPLIDDRVLHPTPWKLEW
ncbi:dTDP-glucose 4,6-dehydratase [Methanothrix harundinacea]|uniref:dTDP-glucose 4,6-dehydratase n=1 Tax=Methanothrix harundinacea (strain 6Ac) TaxID=1110509 RepID=G7WMH2_METH6|nr:dTDP-glucose 4,6-dehydratase [Methanothrix harundinacea]AET64467.1 dTDP-glucose 4,6-dehydratase [Methanothrix harundinacea 6Ac]